MLRRNCVLTLLTGLLFVLSSSAVAQNCDCPQPVPDTKADRESVKREKASAEVNPLCGCPQGEEIEKEAEPAPAHREKARPEYEPEARSIAPRDLPEVYRKQAERSVKAAEVLEDFEPKSWIRDAKAIAVIPGTLKAAFVFGVRRGSGLISRRDENGCWIPPSYIHITGGNFGIQAGIQSTDLVLIFTNDDAVNALLRGKLTLNADASAAAGPLGRKGQVGVPILMNSGIFAFSRSKGLFAGVSLDGAAITVDDSSNANVYGQYISGDEILKARRVESNEAVAPFLNALDTYAPPHYEATAQQKSTTTADTTAQVE